MRRWLDESNSHDSGVRGGGKTVDMVRAKLLLGKFTIYRNISEYGRNGVMKDRKS